MAKIRIPIDVDHPDFPVLSMLRDEIANKVGGLPALTVRFPELVRDAIDFLLDSVRTARTRVSELDNVEKTFIGLKLEHFVRDMLDVPKELRDLRIGGMDVDIKNTVQSNWSIPIETYRDSEPCLLMMVDDHKGLCWLGLIIAKPEYLHAGVGNRDTKKGVSAKGWGNILWIVDGAPIPASRFSGLDMDRFRELRKQPHGNKRFSQFARENLRRVVHRDVIEALLFDQKDYMKRLRKNGGSKDILRREDIAVLIGTYMKDRQLAEQLGIPNLRGYEIVAISPLTSEEWRLMHGADVIASTSWKN